MFPGSYFPKKYFNGNFFPPSGGRVAEFILGVAKFLKRSAMRIFSKKRPGMTFTKEKQMMGFKNDC